ncbi:DUF1501 domain-containing protein [Pedosphaera parvula]|uniref:DUF1501 domain-containing protein n=1 Tax=Pedosphaera parvula (strain Ellin514) TaxID=320771 RepID=B9XJG1_PEDPL|nr:DUF1501 domain-containing protein [Pedosphaera parvula]EEF60022.1 protein of unknown function DUF1501 [Pedosphaera parvula Ellin514]
MQHFHVLTRRGFLDRSFKIGLGVALSTLTDIPLVVKRALAEGNIGLNGKKLIFIFLRGANDGLNAVIPAQDPAYIYNRPNIGIPLDSSSYTQSGPCGFSTTGTANPTFSAADTALNLGNQFAALHPSLRFLAPVYNAGDLALIHRVAYPNQNRSHFDSQNFWESAAPNNNLVKDGIFYRAMVQSGLASSAPLTGVSIQSALPFSLRGSAAAMTNLTDPTRYNLLGVPNTTQGNYKADKAIYASDQFSFPDKLDRDLLNLQYKNMTDTLAIFAGIDFSETGNTFVDNTSGGTDGDAPYYLFPTQNQKNGGAYMNGRTNDTTKYVVDTSAYSLFLNLKAAALILNKTDAIVAGTEYGSFDLHQTQGGVVGSHAKLLKTIGWAMYALQNYFTTYGRGNNAPSSSAKVNWNDVVVVTLSEFGRTTIQNGSAGTDHAEAGVMFVAGGGVKGYNKGNPSGVFGCSPTDSFNGISNLGWAPATSASAQNGSMFGASGRYLKRAVDYRSILGKLIRDHLGATQNQLNQIIPGYAVAGERLLSGGTSSIDGVPIFGELPII